MRIIVIGGGVIGCTSAYWLRLAGHEVALIEQEVEAGHGVSAGNGGQLSYAYVEPLAGPDLWTKFPADPARPRQRGAHAAGPVRSTRSAGAFRSCATASARASRSRSRAC